MSKTDISRTKPANWFDFSEQLSTGGLRAVLSQKDDAHQNLALDEQRNNLIKSLGLNPVDVAVPHQVHSSHVEIARAGHVHPNTDGLFTQVAGTVLTLQVADCAPVYFNHPPSGWHGLVHAGWRGAANGIMAAGLDLLGEQGCPPDELEIVIGNCIGQDCYEVGPEVVANFPAAVWVPGHADRAQLDLSAALNGQLVEGGVSPQNIYISPVCTVCDDNCHSYRRDGARAGRMIALLYYTDE